MKSTIQSYINLTKPTIVFSFALTGFAAMVIERSLLQTPVNFWLVLVGICLTAGSANALNMYFDRDIDQIMTRTKRKRPIPLKTIPPNRALAFGLTLGVIATAILTIYGNALAAGMGVATIFFYIFIYTLFLKRRTPYNIVIGGAAGATAPLIGWAAATNNLTSLEAAVPWLLFLIIFMWTPPHFWALALVLREDYKNAKVPMLPVVAGEKRTRTEILVYSFLLVALTLIPTLIKPGGLIYLVGSSLLGAIFILQAYKVTKEKTDRAAYTLFGYSIVYLILLFMLLMAGALVNKPVTFLI